MKQLFFMKQLFYVLLLMLPLAVTAQSVSSVVYEMKEGKLHIYYLLDASSEDARFDVTAIALFNKTKTAMKSVEGDVGKNIAPGKRLIIWDIIKDKGEIGNVNLEILIEATEITKSTKGTFFVLAAASNVAPLGGRIGYKGNLIGGYLGYKQSIGQPKPFNYTITEAGLINGYPDNNYYTVVNQKYLEGRAITGGLLIGKEFFTAYLGGGIGTERLLWAYDVFDFNDSKLNTEWAANEDFNRQGVLGEAGFIIGLKKIALEVGASSILINEGESFSLDNFQINVGVGVKL
jgi:hypothetical protein